MKKYKLEIVAVILGLVVGIFGYNKPNYDKYKPIPKRELYQEEKKENKDINYIVIPKNSLLLRYNIFSENRSFEIKQPKQVELKGLPDLKSLFEAGQTADIKLVGVALMKDQKIAYIYDNSGKLNVVKEGELIDGKYKVISIENNRVKLVYNKEERILKIFDFGVKN